MYGLSALTRMWRLLYSCVWLHRTCKIIRSTHCMTWCECDWPVNTYVPFVRCSTVLDCRIDPQIPSQCPHNFRFLPISLINLPNACSSPMAVWWAWLDSRPPIPTRPSNNYVMILWIGFSTTITMLPRQENSSPIQSCGWLIFDLSNINTSNQPTIRNNTRSLILVSCKYNIALITRERTKKLLVADENEEVTTKCKLVRAAHFGWDVSNWLTQWQQGIHAREIRRIIRPLKKNHRSRLNNR